LTTATFLTPVQENILRVEERMRAQAELNNHPDLRGALEQLLVSGGKRVRPTVVLLAGGMLGANRDKLVTLGAAVEMLHTATLVHDDLIDSALLRRGMATLNSKWSPAATVLTGDFLFARAARLASDIENVPLMKKFAETLAVIVNGELTQLFAAHGVVNRQNYYSRIYAKTASLFEMSTLSAAMLGTDDLALQDTLRIYGYEIGMAFQMVDDILDFSGDQSVVGKPLGSDLLQGLVTLPAIFYAEQHPADPDVKTLYEGRWQDENSMLRLVNSVRHSNAIELALHEAMSHVERALDALTPFPPSVERDALVDLARYIVDRSV
jgi:geranylgeranyl pyrophosphate synthase